MNTKATSTQKHALRWLAALLIATGGLALTACSDDETPQDELDVGNDTDTDSDPDTDPDPDTEPDTDPDPDPEEGAACTPTEDDINTLLEGRDLDYTASSADEDNDEVAEDGFTHYATFATNNEESFRYLDLNSGVADLSDVDALSSEAWHLALRRTSIRTNSGESGAGNTRIARVQNTRFEDVHSVPAGATWAADASLADIEDGAWTWTTPRGATELSCTFNDSLYAIEAVNSDIALGGSWYHYNLATHVVATRTGDIYLVEDDEGNTWKLELTEYASISGGPATWSLRWAPLQGLGECNADVAEADLDGLVYYVEETYDYEGNDQYSSSSQDTESGIWTATVQAGTGGLGAGFGFGRPFAAMTYVDLDTGDIDHFSDVDALEDGEWEIAFRRSAVRFNSGVIGGGNIEVTRFNEANTAPAPGTSVFETITREYATGKNLVWAGEEILWDWMAVLDEETDEYVAECDFVANFMGGPVLAMQYLNQDNDSSGDWYDYGGVGGLGPVPDTVYVLRDAARDIYWKLEIVSYWSASAAEDAERPVEYEIRWEEL